EWRERRGDLLFDKHARAGDKYHTDRAGRRDNADAEGGGDGATDRDRDVRGSLDAGAARSATGVAVGGQCKGGGGCERQRDGAERRWTGVADGDAGRGDGADRGDGGDAGAYG